MFGGLKNSLGGFRWAAISAARRLTIASEGLWPSDGMACTICSGAANLSATAAAQRDRPDCGKAPVDTDDDGAASHCLDREATYLLGLRNRLGEWPTGVDLVASFRLVVEFRQRRRDLRRGVRGGFAPSFDPRRSLL